MSFSSDAKLEIMRTPPQEVAPAKSELAAALLLSGSVSFLGRGRYVTNMHSESAAVARYCFTRAKALCTVTPQISALRSNQLGDHVSYQLTFTEEDSRALIDQLDLMDGQGFFWLRQTPPPSLTGTSVAQVGWLRGAFLTCGWVSHPDKGYHVEFTTQQESQAQAIQHMLTELGFRCGLSERKSQYVAYVKDGEGVSRLMATLGAFSACMTIENVRIMKQLRSGVNRQLNCDSSNADKIVQAAGRQLDDITYLMDNNLLDTLPRPLKEIAQARYNHPEANLTELGQMCAPPIGKSGVNNRLRRLSAIAEEKRAANDSTPQGAE